MHLNFRNSASVISLLLWLAVPLELSSQHTVRDKLIDLGTLGAPISYGSANGDGGRLLNNSGIVSSYADTSLADPFARFLLRCRLSARSDEHCRSKKRARRPLRNSGSSNDDRY